jgi:protoporphyrinogen oxidase
MAHIAVIGAGAMGLAAAYHALKAGHRVTIYEADRVPGGMAAHFDFGGMSIERFYHFVCTPDQPTFDLMKELGIGDQMVWVETSMGYFIDGTHHKWGDPVSLLRFPLMSLIEKIRYGASAFYQTKRPDFDRIEHMTAKDWIIRDCGKRVYDLMWRRLLELKFYGYTDHISASWIATRIRRVGRSRKSIFQERLGHIAGGSQTLVDRLVAEIDAMGGTLRLATPVDRVETEGGRVTGVTTAQGTHPHDHVISTVPTPFVSAMIPDLSEQERGKLDAIDNIGCICLLLKLKKRVSPHFWLNVMDERMDIPGIIEFSNLRELPDHVVYVPYYMPTTHPKWQQGDATFIADAMAYLTFINPDLTDDDLIDSTVGRLRHAQPVCTPGFLDKIPPVQTSIEGLQVADTCYYYPEDRGISESVRLARKMAAAIPADQG